MARNATILTVFVLVALVMAAPATAGDTVEASDASPGTDFAGLQTATDEMDDNGSDDTTDNNESDDDGMGTSNETDDSMTETTEMDGDEMDDDEMDDEMTETEDMDDSMTDTDTTTDEMSGDGMDDEMQEDTDEGGIGSIGQPGFGVVVGVLAIALAAGLLARRRR